MLGNVAELAIQRNNRKNPPKQGIKSIFADKITY